MIHYIKHYGKIFVLEFVCILVCVPYMLCLSKFNKTLIELQIQGMSDMELLSWSNGLAWKFFIVAAILFLVVFCVILHRGHYILSMKYRNNMNVEAFWSIIAIICMILLIWGLFELIYIPILRIILKVTGIAGLFISCFVGSDNNAA